MYINVSYSSLSSLTQNLGLVSFLSTTSPFDAVLESFFKFQDLFFTHVVFCTLAHFFPLLNVSHSRLSSTPFLLSSHATPLLFSLPLSPLAERSGGERGECVLVLPLRRADPVQFGETKQKPEKNNMILYDLIAMRESLHTNARKYVGRNKKECSREMCVFY